jgi:hypothetical protein
MTAYTIRTRLLEKNVLDISNEQGNWIEVAFHIGTNHTVMALVLLLNPQRWI